MCVSDYIAHFIQRYFEEHGIDPEGRIRNDTWELRPEIQQECMDLWKQVTTENLKQISDYDDYKKQFLQLFGFEIPGVDYSKDQNIEVEIPDLVNMVAARK